MSLARYHPGSPPKPLKHPGKNAPLLLKIFYYLRASTRPKSWYREVFLTSGYWKNKSKEIKARDGYRCTKCGSDGKETNWRCQRTNPLDVHHHTYDRIGHERRQDLTTLCRKCHKVADKSRQGKKHLGQPDRRKGIMRFLPPLPTR